MKKILLLFLIYFSFSIRLFDEQKKLMNKVDEENFNSLTLNDPSNEIEEKTMKDYDITNLKYKIQDKIADGLDNLPEDIYKKFRKENNLGTIEDLIVKSTNDIIESSKKTLSKKIKKLAKKIPEEERSEKSKQISNKVFEEFNRQLDSNPEKPCFEVCVEKLKEEFATMEETSQIENSDIHKACDLTVNSILKNQDRLIDTIKKGLTVDKDEQYPISNNVKKKLKQIPLKKKGGFIVLPKIKNVKELAEDIVLDPEDYIKN